MGEAIRVLIAKPGLDGHDRGAKVLARALRDAGMEVVYLGLHNTPGEIARAAVDEDVDVIGLSFLSGAHVGLTRKVIAELREAGAGTIPVVVGGTIPRGDFPSLEEAGVAGIQPTGVDLDDAVEAIRRAAEARG